WVRAAPGSQICRVDFGDAVTLPPTLRLRRPGGAIPPAGSMQCGAPRGNSLIVLRDAFGSQHAFRRVESTRSRGHEKLDLHKMDIWGTRPCWRNANAHCAGNGAGLRLSQRLQLRTSWTTRELGVADRALPGSAAGSDLYRCRFSRSDGRGCARFRRTV